MTDIKRSVTMRVPITMNIGPVPDGVTSHSQLFTFALGHIKKILADKGVVAEFDGARAIAAYADGDAVASFTHLGAKLDDRHYRLQPADGGRHALQISVDGGKSFATVADFDDYDFARGVGEAWVDGRAEKVA